MPTLTVGILRPEGDVPEIGLKPAGGLILVVNGFIPEGVI